VERPTLRGCWAKIERAREHAHRLETTAEAFLKRRPHQVVFDDYSDPKWIIVRAVIEPMPIQFSVTAGDLIHNLRSALDHLAWQLVLIAGSTPGRHTSFPIYISKPDFDGRVRNPPEGRKSPLDGIDPESEIWAQVEHVQPYNPGYEDFGRVATFSNRDKHQGLIAAVSYMHTLDLDELATISGGGEVVRSFKPPDALAHDTELFRVAKTGSVQVQMKADPPAQITVSDGEVAVPIDGLDKLRSLTVAVIRNFERFFP